MATIASSSCQASGVALAIAAELAEMTIQALKRADDGGAMRSAAENKVREPLNPVSRCLPSRDRSRLAERKSPSRRLPLDLNRPTAFVAEQVTPTERDSTRHRRISTC